MSAITRCASPRSTRSHSAPREDAGDQVEGEQPLGAAALLVDREGDALDQEGALDDPLLLLELLGRGRGEVLRRAGRSAARGTPGAANISS